MAIEIPMPKLGLTMEEALIIRVARRRRRRRRSGPADPPHRDRQDRDRGRCAGQRPAPPDRRAGRRVPLRPADRAPARARARRRRNRSRPLHQHRRLRRQCRCPVQRPSPAHRLPRLLAVVPAGGRLLSPRRTPRRTAAELGVALRTVRGTGPGGRIVSEDVRRRPAGSAHAVAGTAPGSRSPRSPPRTLADLLGIDLADRARRPGGTPRHPRRCRRARSPAPRTARGPHPRHPPRARSRRLRRRQRHRRRRCSRSCRSPPRRSGCRGCGARSPSGCTPRCRRWRS